MKRYLIGVSGLVGLLVVILILALVPWKSLSHQDKPIRVVTGMNFYGEIAKAVAGSHGQVISFIDNASVDPHDYQPGTKQSQQLGEANVVIENGLGYDAWLNKLVKANGNQKLKVITVSNLVGKKPVIMNIFGMIRRLLRS